MEQQDKPNKALLQARTARLRAEYEKAWDLGDKKEMARLRDEMTSIALELTKTHS